MLIRYLGHSEFLLTDEHGAKVVTDPYDDHVGYPVQPVACGAVTVSVAIAVRPLSGSRAAPSCWTKRGPTLPCRTCSSP